MIYGAIVAWIALLIIAKVPVLGLGTVWPAIVVVATIPVAFIACAAWVAFIAFEFFKLATSLF